MRNFFLVLSWLNVFALFSQTKQFDTLIVFNKKYKICSINNVTVGGPILDTIKFCKPSHKTKYKDILGIDCAEVEGGNTYSTLDHITVCIKKKMKSEYLPSLLDTIKVNFDSQNYSEIFLCTDNEKIEVEKLSIKIIALESRRDFKLLHPQKNKKMQDLIDQKLKSNVIILESISFIKNNTEYIIPYQFIIKSK
jgi:hypothetical protein